MFGIKRLTVPGFTYVVDGKEQRGLTITSIKSEERLRYPYQAGERK
jgi:hypothetical protein